MAGRLCARAALRSLGHTTDGAIAIGALGAPVWPAGFVGSITHSGGTGAAAVTRSSDARSIGIDLQPLLAPQQAVSLAPLFGGPAEHAALARIVGDHVLACTVLFSAKEALYKCLAPLVGRRFDFLDVESRPDGHGKLALHLRTDLGSDFSTGRVLEARFGTFLGGTALATVLLPGSGRSP